MAFLCHRYAFQNYYQSIFYVVLVLVLLLDLERRNPGWVTSTGVAGRPIEGRHVGTWVGLSVAISVTMTVIFLSGALGREAWRDAVELLRAEAHAGDAVYVRTASLRERARLFAPLRLANPEEGRRRDDPPSHRHGRIWVVTHPAAPPTLALRISVESHGKHHFCFLGGSD